MCGLTDGGDKGDWLEGLGGEDDDGIVRVGIGVGSEGRGVRSLVLLDTTLPLEGVRVTFEAETGDDIDDDDDDDDDKGEDDDDDVLVFEGEVDPPSIDLAGDRLLLICLESLTFSSFFSPLLSV